MSKQSICVPTNVRGQGTMIIDCKCAKWKRCFGIILDDQDVREWGYKACPYCKKPFEFTVDYIDVVELEKRFIVGNG